MKQKGQGIVEFAIIAPLLVALGVAIIYVGIMFIDYTQYSNAARDAARDIALQLRYAENTGSVNEANKSINAQRQYLVTAIHNNDETVLKRYQNPLTRDYEPHWDAKFYKFSSNTFTATSPYNDATNADVVEVSVALELQGEFTSYLASWGILPKVLKPISYRMVLEEATLVDYGKYNDSSTTTSTSN